MPKIINKDLRKNIILECSKKVFKEKGYKNGTLKDIAKEAGISTASLYNIYKNKEEIYWELVNFIVSKVIERMELFLEYDQKYFTIEAVINNMFDNISYLMKEHDEMIFFDFFIESVHANKLEEFKQKIEKIKDRFTNLSRQLLKKVFINIPEISENDKIIETISLSIMFLRDGMVGAFLMRKLDYSSNFLAQFKENVFLLKDIITKYNKPR